jgi:hypothetical protein
LGGIKIKDSRWFTNGHGSEWAMNSQTPMAAITRPLPDDKTVMEFLLR